MSSRRKMEREEKRERIIDAAVEVFAKKGFFGSKIAEIADAAGVADGTIYLYFKSKDDLLISVFEEKMAWIVKRLQALLASIDDPEEQMRRYITAHLELAAAQPTLMQVLTVELRQSARFIKEYSPKGFARYLAIIGHILEKGQAKGVFRRDLEPAIFRRALFGAIDELAFEWVLRGSDATKPDPKLVGEVFAEFILRGLRNDAPHSTISAGASGSTS